MQKFMAFIKDVAVPVISVITAAMVVFLNKSVADVQAQLRERELAMKEFELSRLDRESLQTLNFKVYDAVKSSLESRNLSHQRVAEVLVITMPVDSSLRQGLMNVLLGSDQTDPEIKKRVATVQKKEAEFRNQEKDLRVLVKSEASADEKKWNFDIFWCETSGATAQQRAASLKAALESGGYSGRLRVRLLPNSINLRAGYQINGIEIRHNTWEEEQAQAIKALIETSADFTGEEIQLRVVSQNTPNYISIFVCS